MPESPKAAKNRSPLQHLQLQVDRLPVRPSGLLELGHALAGQSDPVTERECNPYQRALPDYVEAEVNGQPVRRLFPDMARHLELCPNCGQVYVDLLGLALEAEAKPLPIPSSAPMLDLSFLPSLTPAERICQVIEPLAKEILRRLDPKLLADLPAAGRALCQRLGELGIGLQIRPGSAPALGFGAELPPAFQSLVAVCVATVQVIQTLSTEELETELASARPSDVLRKHAHSAAREVGMGRREANRWAELYVAQAQTHAAALVALARQMTGHEQSD